ncbi:hypothetical protein BDF22DRAFT_744129 [Syncephalis plumigaleata]|nr:hypothetical protein BDF22DRAFT_744129 [Syncephalis plumigaleata]
METQSALASSNHTLPLVMMHAQQQQLQQQQQQQQHLLLLQQQQQQASQQHLTPPPQQIIAPQAFASPIVRPGVHMMPMMPMLATDHVNASLCTPVNNQAAAQLFYQQQLLQQQQQLHMQLHQAQVQAQAQAQAQAQVQVQPSPPAAIAVTAAAPAIVSQQVQQQYPSPPQMASTVALPPASISPADMNAATVYNFPALPAYLQAHLQLRKSNLRNGDVFFYAGDDLTADIDGVIGHLRPGSPTLSPPLSPTDFQLNNVTEAEAPLFAYEARESVEFPVPNSPPSDAELEERLLKPSASDKLNNDVSFNKPTFIPLAPLLAIVPDTANGEMMNGNANQNGKTALQVLSRHLCSGVLPTPPEMTRASMSFDTETTTATTTATAITTATTSSSSETAVVDMDVTTNGSRKRKASSSASSGERNPTKSTPRKRRANSVISTDSNGHSIVSTTSSTSTSSASTSSSSSSSSSTTHHRKKLNKPAPIVIKTEASEMSPSPVTRDDREPASPRKTQRPTVFEQLTEASVDWCRYCGTTEGVNWRPGPWGKRTLCNKHGCDYKGYGFACKLPRLNLTAYQRESIHDRERPVLQLFCTVCHSDGSWCNDILVSCEGCPKSYHQRCYTGGISDEEIKPSSGSWYCTPNCEENARKRRIIVELPRKRLPLMRSPKDDDINDATAADCMVSMRRGSSASLSEDGGSPRIRHQLATPPLPVGMRARSYSATTAAAMSSRRTARARPRLFYGEVDMEEDDTNNTNNNNGNLNRSTPLSAGNDGALSCRSLLEEQFRFSTSSLNSVNNGTISDHRQSPRSTRTAIRSTLLDHGNDDNDVVAVKGRVHHRENNHVDDDDDDDDDEEDVAAARVLVDDEEDEDEEDDDIEEHDGAIIGWS